MNQQPLPATSMSGATKADAEMLKQLCLGQLPRGVPYINIGTRKCCLFLHMSLFLCSRLRAYPLLYYAIEEGLECAKQGYRAAGILALSQLLNVMMVAAPDERHRVAHELLERRPTKTDFDRVLQQVKDTARLLHQQERKRKADTAAYERELAESWAELMTSLHPS